jgi:hypothetical protein
MKLKFLPVAAATLSLVATSLLAENNNHQDLNPKNAPPMLGIHWAKGQAPAHFARPSRALMSYHGGVIMPKANTFAIFRGTSWGSYSGDKISGMDTWYQGFIGSNYAATVNEWTQSNGTHANSATGSHEGHTIDTAAETAKGSTSAVLAEVCANLSAAQKADPEGYYPLYSDQPRGNAGYCAWHSAGTCSGSSTTIQFAFFWKLDGDSGCDPQSAVSGESQGLTAIANVSGHELAEAMSDPDSPGAWYDASGAENGDKCAWTFGAPFVTFANGSQWKIQGEWSNAAYSSGTGYPNSSGQKGCLSGL